MNREILFRGKDEKGGWHNGFYVQQPKDSGSYHEPPSYEKNHFIVSLQSVALPFIEILPETLGQFTGLVDKNGTKIFEGDLIQTGGPLYLISFQNGAFVAASKFGYPTPLGYYETVHGIREFEKPGQHNLSDFCVSGNIHDNPDLWKH